MDITATIKYNESGDMESVLLSKESFMALITSGKVTITAVSSQAVNSISKETERPESIESTVSKILGSLGVPKCIKGYAYLRDAIVMCANDYGYISNITKHLYPEIARNHADTTSRVERAIRHAIEVFWLPNNIEKFNAMFGTSYDLYSRKPVNSEFIALVADNLRLEKAC